MAVCLSYQAVYVRKNETVHSTKLQAAAGILLLLALAAKVWIKLETTESGYELARARQLTVELDTERRELELQASVLLRPDSLAKAAKGQLGLREHDIGQLIRFSHGGLASKEIR